jgi:hypothetical protein
MTLTWNNSTPWATSAADEYNNINSPGQKGPYRVWSTGSKENE